MRHALIWAAAAAFLLFPRSVMADTVIVADPYPELWEISAGASYLLQGETVHPQSGTFSVAPPGAPALQPRVSLPAEGQPGDLLLLELDSPSPLASAQAALQAPIGRAFSRADGFRLAGERWVALLGIPPQTAPGEYTLALTARQDVRRFLVLAPFTVKPREFPNERIPLTRQLTDLRTVPDPQKTAEARQMAQILSKPHPEALYGTTPFVLPLVGTHRSSGYGDRRTYEYSNGRSDVSVHEGVDIAAPSGSPVVACGRGNVVFAGPFLLTGSTVIIEHLPGLFSLYYHLSVIEVQQGQVVEAGQEIGKVGMTGFATGPHLHWEVQSLGTSVDPDLLVGRVLVPERGQHAASPEGSTTPAGPGSSPTPQHP